jgi:hypothetical protein
MNRISSDSKFLDHFNEQKLIEISFVSKEETATALVFLSSLRKPRNRQSSRRDPLLFCFPPSFPPSSLPPSSLHPFPPLLRYNKTPFVQYALVTADEKWRESNDEGNRSLPLCHKLRSNPIHHLPTEFVPPVPATNSPPKSTPKSIALLTESSRFISPCRESVSQSTQLAPTKTTIQATRKQTSYVVSLHWNQVFPSLEWV